MTQRDLKRRIFLTGIAGRYQVATSGYGGLLPFVDVSDYALGNAMVRALRDYANKHPQLFPSSNVDA